MFDRVLFVFGSHVLYSRREKNLTEYFSSRLSVPSYQHQTVIHLRTSDFAVHTDMSLIQSQKWA